MKNIKNIYKIALYILPILSIIISFLIIKPTSVVGVLITLGIGLVTYFFLWLIDQILKPQFKNQYVKSLKSQYNKEEAE